jgi:ribonuclease-3
LADATEAVLGAIYLDQGLEPVRRFVADAFAESLAPDAPRVERDPKTELNEEVMASSGEFPTYELVRDTEVENDDQRFTVQVRIRGEVCGKGGGRTKQAAEVSAARTALFGLLDG